MNNDSVVFIPVTPLNLAVLQKVALQAYKDHYLHLWYEGGEWYMQKSFSLEQLQQETANNNARFFIVEVDGLPSGFIKINIDAPFEEEPNALELERIYFIKQVSGKGIGTTSVNYVFAIAKSLGKKLVWLKVMDSSIAAIGFYKKMGFDICGTYHLDFPAMKEELRGMYIMKKQLP